MLPLTKMTIITWFSRETQEHSELEAERVAKLEQMTADQKTDNVPIYISESITRRDWVDQAAAEEYRDFIFAMDDKHGPQLVVNVEILDAE